MSLRNKLLLASAIAFVASPAFAYAQGVKERRSLAPIELKPAEPTPYVKGGELVDDAAEEDLPEYDSQTDDSQADGDSRFPGAGTIPADAEISVQPASHISLDTLGLYDESQGGLPRNVWRNSDHARISELLTKLPSGIPSEAVRKLVTRLLLTSAEAPESENIQQTIFRPRIEALIQLGEASQAQRLMDMAPKDQRNEGMTRLEYTTHLIGNDVKWACEHVSEALGSSTTDAAFYQKLSLFCLARSGREAEAQLAIDAAGEQGRTLDPAFSALLDSMLGHSAQPNARFAKPLAFEDASLIAVSGKDAFPEGYLDTAPLPIVRLVADNSTFPELARAQANKRLVEVKAGDKRTPQQQAMRGWFAQQFARSFEAPYDFDDAVKQMALKSGAPADTRKSYRFYNMLQGLGFSDLHYADTWKDASIAQSERLGVAPWLRAEMAVSVDAERMGESILLLATIAGQADSLAELDDDVMTELVLALSQLGLLKEAQELAAEAMVSLY